MDRQPIRRSWLFSFPTRTITLSFAAVILVGTLLLMLPVSSRAGAFTPFLDCLFTATSSTCVTGLVVHDTYAYWSAFGQCVILALIQIGGLGLVTLTTFFNIAIGRKLGLRGMHLAQESVASTGPDINQLMKVVMITALTVETAGALLLATVFVPEFGAEGIFISVFTSVSAFCNAGFDIFGRAEPYVSLTGYVGNPIVVGTVGLLIIVGGIGFIVIHDLLQYRRTKKLLLHTRIVIVSTVSLILVGMAFTAVCERFPNAPASITMANSAYTCARSPFIIDVAAIPPAKPRPSNVRAADAHIGQPRTSALPYAPEENAEHVDKRRNAHEHVLGQDLEPSAERLAAAELYLAARKALRANPEKHDSSEQGS